MLISGVYVIYLHHSFAQREILLKNALAKQLSDETQESYFQWGRGRKERSTTRERQTSSCLESKGTEEGYWPTGEMKSKEVLKRVLGCWYRKVLVDGKNKSHLPFNIMNKIWKRLCYLQSALCKAVPAESASSRHLINVSFIFLFFLSFHSWRYFVIISGWAMLCLF